ncbi:MAG: PAS domain S-box protein [Hyphomicrobiales bacterium]|nr:PAS domain S-box protein [Hyphomicrobiales bacterium]MDE2114186.1 PAS domain S-box protein [Hyphomicrobiales bacterium]
MLVSDLPFPKVKSGDRTGLLLAALPVMAIILLIGVVAAVVWYTTASAKSQAREQLLRDALWVEQTFRFQLASDEDNVAALALDVGENPSGEETFLSRSRVFLAGTPEIISINWITAKGEIKASLPLRSTDKDGLSRALAARLVPYSIKPVVGPIHRLADGEIVVDLSAPVGGQRGDRVVATLSLSTFVLRQVPWWIAERYSVQFLDDKGQVIAEKTQMPASNFDATHVINFDPPLAGTSLGLSRYRHSQFAILPTLLAALIALSCFVILSIVLMRRHARQSKIIEDKLSAEIAFRRAMETSLTIGMRARDLSGIITYANPAFCQMVGFSADELIGVQPPMPYWLPDQIEETLSRRNSRIFGERKAHSFESRMRSKDGRVFDVLIYEAPLLDSEGVNHGWLGSIIDITERKTSAETLRRQTDVLARTGRLVTLGEMASTLAHELNQPLASITSYAQGSLNLLRQDPEDHAPIISAIEKVSAQSVRAGRIIQRIRDFVRKQEPHFHPLDIEDLITSSVAFMTAEAASAGVTIKLIIDKKLDSPRADKILMQQALLNLIKNGIEAMETVANKLLQIRASQDQTHVRIEVSDHGRGFDPEIEGRLFDAFMSTKPEGMGMGLNICRSIVEQHHGQLTCTKQPLGGVTFTICLPRPLKVTVGKNEGAQNVPA